MASQRANSVFLSLVKGISWNFLVTCARRVSASGLCCRSAWKGCNTCETRYGGKSWRLLQMHEFVVLFLSDWPTCRSSSGNLRLEEAWGLLLAVSMPNLPFVGPHRNIFPTLSRDGAPINAEATVETNIAYYQLFANDVHALLPSVPKAVHVRFSSLLRHNLVILFLLLFNLKQLFHGWLFTEKLSAFDLFLVPSVESQQHPYTVAAMHAYDMLTIYVIHTLLLQCIHCILYNFTIRDIGIQTM